MHEEQVSKDNQREKDILWPGNILSGFKADDGISNKQVDKISNKIIELDDSLKKLEDSSNLPSNIVPSIEKQIAAQKNDEICLLPQNRIAAIRKESLELLKQLKRSFGPVKSDLNIKETVFELCDARVKDKLASIPISEINRNRVGISVPSLLAAGVKNLLVLSRLSKSSLISIFGVGEKRANLILREFALIKQEILDELEISVPCLNSNKMEDNLVKEVFCFLRYKNICSVAKESYGDLYINLKSLYKEIRVYSFPFIWILLPPNFRQHISSKAMELWELVNSLEVDSFKFLYKQFLDVGETSIETICNDSQSYRENYKDFFSLSIAAFKEEYLAQKPDEINSSGGNSKRFNDSLGLFPFLGWMLYGLLIVGLIAFLGWYIW